MEWEGQDVLEVVEEPIPVLLPVDASVDMMMWSSDEDSVESGDEYVDETKKTSNGKVARKVCRCLVFPDYHMLSDEHRIEQGR